MAKVVPNVPTVSKIAQKIILTINGGEGEIPYNVYFCDGDKLP
jgi:hypothetical protein